MNCCYVSYPGGAGAGAGGGEGERPRCSIQYPSLGFFLGFWCLDIYGHCLRCFFFLRFVVCLGTVYMQAVYVRTVATFFLEVFMSRKQKVASDVGVSAIGVSPIEVPVDGALEELVCLLERCCVLADSGEALVLGVDAAWVRRHLESALAGARKGLK